MFSSSFTTAFGLLLLTFSVQANPILERDDGVQVTALPQTFKDNNNNLACMGANDTLYTSATESKWGIMCAFDTYSNTFFADYADLTFDQCIEKCQDHPDCVIATFTGHCYLKKSTKGQPFVRFPASRADDRTAYNLKRYDAIQGTHLCPKDS